MTTHEQFADDLVLYAMGSLEDAAARDTLLAHLDQCRECRREFEQLQADFAALALTTEGPAAPTRSEKRLMDAIATEPRQVIVRRPRRRWSLLLAPYAFALLVAAIAVGLFVDSRYLRAQLRDTRARAEAAEKQSQSAMAVLAALNAQDAQRFTLTSAPALPQPQGRATYLARTGRGVFMASNLNPVPPGKAYELWMLPASGAAPMAAGVFKPDPAGNASMVIPEMPAGTQAKGFAITLEPESGSSTPTMPLVLVGLGQ